MRMEFRRARRGARWTAEELAAVVGAVLATAPDTLWSVDDLRERLAFGREGGGPAASSVRAALRVLRDRGALDQVEVWGRRGWGGTAYAYRAAAGDVQTRLPVAA
jgi:hypothetical protein